MGFSWACTTTAWVHSPNPGQHRKLGLNANTSRDAEAVYVAAKGGYQVQATVMHDVIATLNIAIPKAFKCRTTAVGSTLIGASAYHSNHDPRAILLALSATYSIPSPVKHIANDTAFTAPWNTTESIETTLKGLKTVTY